jgi:hypothetical protein
MQTDHVSAYHPLASDAGEQRQSGVNIAWVVEKNTPTATLDVLRSAGFSHIVQGPLYPSKLERLVASIAANQPAPRQQQSWKEPSPRVTSDSHVIQVDKLFSVTPALTPSLNPSLTPPLTPSSLQPSPETSASPGVGGPGHTPGPFTGLNAMVVEDNPILRQLATRTLAKLGAKVEARCDGQEAVDTVREYRSGGRGFDLILMDCQVG